MNRPALSTLFPVALLRRRRIGLFGGSFNPPHAGHRHIAEEALKRLQLDEVWWLPARRNPLKAAGIYADFHTRLRQTERIARHPRFRVLDWQWRLGTDYTVDLLRALAPLLAQARSVWIMGADSFATLHRWRRWRTLVETIPIAVFDRPGYTIAALMAPAARAFAEDRLHAQEAPRLPRRAPPAWVFVSIHGCAESSTRRRRLGAQAWAAT